MSLPVGLRDTVQASLAARRPLLHHLNADTSWLLQLPRPHTSPTSCRYWYNVLIDPWLTGSQSDVASWFSQQWHAQTPVYGSIAAVDRLCKEVETMTAEFLNKDGRSITDDNSVSQSSAAEIKTSETIDAVAISHEFTDHCHRETLLQVSQSVPILAATKAADLIKRWKHFDTVLEAPLFRGDKVDWRETSLSPLPEWVSISRLVEESNALYYHSAVLFTFEKDGGNGEAEAVVYTPHGIHAEPLKQLVTASPSISTLALLHGLHDIKISRAKQLNLGAHNGLEAQRILGATYWIGTHDEIKKGGGIINYFIRRQVISVKEALEFEIKRSNEKDVKMVEEVKFLDVRNGDVHCLQ